jgi:hypothetical protein
LHIPRNAPQWGVKATYRVSRSVIQSCDVEAETPQEALRSVTSADDFPDWDEPPISEWRVYKVGEDGIASKKLNLE